MILNHEQNKTKREVNVSDIFYIESIDKSAVVYCEKEKYKTKFRLNQLNELGIDDQLEYAL